MAGSPNSADVMNGIELLINPRRRPSSESMSTISSASHDSAASRPQSPPGSGSRSPAHPHAHHHITIDTAPSPQIGAGRNGGGAGSVWSQSQRSGNGGMDHSNRWQGGNSSQQQLQHAAPGAGGRASSALSRQPTDDDDDDESEEEEEESEEEESEQDDGYNNHKNKRSAEVGFSPEEVLRMKRELLYQFDSLERKGIRLPRKFTLSDSLEDMRADLDRIKLDREVAASIRFQRKFLMTCVTGIELLNSKFDPFDVKLDGWSDSMYDNLNDYDDVFEELHMKYRSKAKMAPELKLMFMVGGSGVMFHMTNSMFRSSSTPGLEQIMRQNPELMRQFTQATISAMQNGGGNGAGGGLAGPPPPPASSRSGGGGGGGILGGIMNLFGGGGGGGNNGGAPTHFKHPPPPPPSQQPGGGMMRGPRNVNDILDEMHQDAFSPNQPQQQHHHVERVIEDSDSDMSEIVGGLADGGGRAAGAGTGGRGGGGARRTAVRRGRINNANNAAGSASVASGQLV